MAAPVPSPSGTAGPMSFPSALDPQVPGDSRLWAVALLGQCPAPPPVAVKEAGSCSPVPWRPPAGRGEDGRAPPGSVDGAWQTAGH